MKYNVINVILTGNSLQYLKTNDDKLIFEAVQISRWLINIISKELDVLGSHLWDKHKDVTTI